MAGEAMTKAAPTATAPNLIPGQFVSSNLSTGYDLQTHVSEYDVG